MTKERSAVRELKPNPDWAALPLFDRSKWERVRFGNVVRMLKEEVDPASGEVERYVAGEHMETENVHIRSWGTVGDGYLGPAFIRRFRKGQVLYGSRRTYLKKVALAEWDGVTANTTFVLEAVPARLRPDLLPWLMLSERFTRHSVQESKGSTNPYINFPDIAKFEFDLPPLDQQRRIAEILDGAATLHRRRLELSAALWTARGAKLGSLFKGEHVRGKRIEIAGWGVGRIAGICDLPAGWRVERLTSIARLESGHTPRRSIESYWRDGDVPWISLHDTDGLKQRYIATTAQMPTPAGIRNSSARLLPAGTVVFCRTASVGLCSIMKKEMSTSQDFANFVCGPEILNEYLYHLLRWMTPVWEGLMGGSTHKTIYMPDFQKLEVILPPTRQQSFIAQQANALDDTVDAVKAQENSDQQMLMALVNSCL